MPASDLQFLSDHGVAFLWQILAAITAGGLLGYERQRMSKPVGMLTATLVTLGSTVIVLAGSLLVGEGSGAEDPTRLTVAVAADRANEFLEFLAENQIAVGRTRIRSDGERVVLSINECGVEHRGELMHALRRFDGVIEVTAAAGNAG